MRTMDVERIQKINDLALDLMKRGLATSRDEAVVQAEHVYERKNDDEGYRQIREKMQTNVSPQDSNSPHLSQEKIQDILQQNATFLVQKIKEFQGKVEAMEKEMNQLRQQVRNQAQSTVREASPPASQLREVSSGQQPPAPHPRVGSFTNQDVSIEKMFYMGNKK